MTRFPSATLRHAPEMRCKTALSRGLWQSYKGSRRWSAAASPGLSSRDAGCGTFLFSSRHFNARPDSYNLRDSSVLEALASMYLPNILLGALAVMSATLFERCRGFDLLVTQTSVYDEYPSSIMETITTQVIVNAWTSSGSPPPDYVPASSATTMTTVRGVGEPVRKTRTIVSLWEN